MTQPFPKFYIIRPDGSLTPLIPVDELPKWVSFANWDPEDISMYSYMYAASLTSFPREGEYDLVCHNCFAQVDGHHRSVSEQSDLGISMPLPALTYGDAISMSGSALGPAPSQITKVPLLSTISKRPPFHANLYSPFVGMCLVSFPRLRWPFRLGSTAQDQEQNQDQDQNQDQNQNQNQDQNQDRDHTDEGQGNEERHGRRRLPSTSSSEAEVESDIEEAILTPLLEGLNRLRQDARDASFDDLELGYGTFPRDSPYLEGASEPSKPVQSDEGSAARNVAPKRSIIVHTVSSSRRGTKRVRFDPLKCD
ncbi:uncharacterized protein LDX57_004536 [Aspergillus melleus]|uniref:uncharacterized protein n=1 Tax=Aspergillus melleus TaxID=138277 RepID=UPI001E8D9069|nr:uncharacterized protein LDX57_004536 [Aspergillus melleus]KAH8426806.1 hypothetical protein LDX57_004536 [Aspergillus melleus]